MPPMAVEARIAAHTDYLTPRQAAEELCVEVARINQWALDDADPFPVRLPPGNTRHGVVYRPEMDAWVARNWALRTEEPISRMARSNWARRE